MDTLPTSVSMFPTMVLTPSDFSLVKAQYVKCSRWSLMHYHKLLAVGPENGLSGSSGSRTGKAGAQGLEGQGPDQNKDKRSRVCWTKELSERWVEALVAHSSPCRQVAFGASLMYVLSQALHLSRVDPITRVVMQCAGDVLVASSADDTPRVLVGVPEGHAVTQHLPEPFYWRAWSLPSSCTYVIQLCLRPQVHAYPLASVVLADLRLREVHFKHKDDDRYSGTRVRSARSLYWEDADYAYSLPATTLREVLERETLRGQKEAMETGLWLAQHYTRLAELSRVYLTTTYWGESFHGRNKFLSKFCQLRDATPVWRLFASPVTDTEDLVHVPFALGSSLVSWRRDHRGVAEHLCGGVVTNLRERRQLNHMLWFMEVRPTVVVVPQHLQLFVASQLKHDGALGGYGHLIWSPGACRDWQSGPPELNPATGRPLVPLAVVSEESFRHHRCLSPNGQDWYRVVVYPASHFRVPYLQLGEKLGSFTSLWLVYPGDMPTTRHFHVYQAWGLHQVKWWMDSLGHQTDLPLFNRLACVSAAAEQTLAATPLPGGAVTELYDPENASRNTLVRQMSVALRHCQTPPLLQRLQTLLLHLEFGVMRTPYHWWNHLLKLSDGERAAGNSEERYRELVWSRLNVDYRVPESLTCCPICSSSAVHLVVSRKCLRGSGGGGAVEGSSHAVCSACAAHAFAVSPRCCLCRAPWLFDDMVRNRSPDSPAAPAPDAEAGDPVFMVPSALQAVAAHIMYLMPTRSSAVLAVTHYPERQVRWRLGLAQHNQRTAAGLPESPYHDSAPTPVVVVSAEAARYFMHSEWVRYVLFLDVGYDSVCVWEALHLLDPQRVSVLYYSVLNQVPQLNGRVGASAVVKKLWGCHQFFDLRAPLPGTFTTTPNLNWR